MEKRAAKWLVELQNKAVRLDREVFGVQQPALGPRAAQKAELSVYLGRTAAATPLTPLSGPEARCTSTF